MKKIRHEHFAKRNGECMKPYDYVRIYFTMNGKDRCFETTDERDYNLVLQLLLNCGYKIKSDTKSPTAWVTRTICLELQEETEYAKKLGVEL